MDAQSFLSALELKVLQIEIALQIVARISKAYTIIINIIDMLLITTRTLLEQICLD